MKILGIDPGSRKAGFGIIKLEGKKIHYIESGFLKYDDIDFFLSRLGIIYTSCKDLAEKFLPDEIAIESLIYVKSVEALSKLAQARGAMIAGFSEKYNGKIFEYAPNLIKSSITGNGHAEKEAVNKTLSMMFGKINFKTSDESDALAIAVTHALNRKSILLKRELNI